jgi:hypothetical protein
VPERSARRSFSATAWFMSYLRAGVG